MNQQRDRPSDTEIIARWRARCKTARAIGKHSAPMLADGALTVAEVVAKIRAEVEVRRRPQHRRSDGRLLTISREYERTTRHLEIEANWLEEQVGGGV